MRETGAAPEVNSGAAPRQSSRSVWRVQFFGQPGWICYVAVLTFCFIVPLARLMAHASQSNLHSHIPLIPLIAAYALYTRRDHEPTDSRRALVPAALLAAIGLGAIGSALTIGATLSANDYLSITTLAYLALLAAGGFFFLGSQWMSSVAFPMSFLLFMVPLPDAAVDWMERMSVLGSAEVAAWFFSVTGTPLLREGTIFALPTIVLEVAQECSGIRSSWVLFITSVLASHMLLTSPWRRLALVAFVIPLGIARNGFRILVIGLLCVNIGPQMIDSVIHHRGGPIFFVLSLGPLFLLLWWLRSQERDDRVKSGAEGPGGAGDLLTMRERVPPSQ